MSKRNEAYGNSLFIPLAVKCSDKLRFAFLSLTVLNLINNHFLTSTTVECLTVFIAKGLISWSAQFKLKYDTFIVHVNDVHIFHSKSS